MKVRIYTPDFLKLLKKIDSIADNKNSMTILSFALIKVDKNGITLSATDLEMGYQGTVVPMEVEGEGAFCLPARKLYQIVKNFPDVILVIEARNGEVVIGNPDGDIAYNLAFSPAEDFPVLPTIHEEAMVEITGKVLQDMFKKTLYATLATESSYGFSGVLVSREDTKLRLVATDGHRLAMVEQEMPWLEGSNFLETSVIVPRKAARLVGHIAGEETEVKIGVQDGHFFLATSEGLFMARLLESQFPDYRQAMVPNYERVAVFDRAKLVAALKRVSLLSPDKFQPVKFEFSPGEVLLVSSAEEIGEAREKLPVAYEGEDFAVTFNSRYVLDALEVMSSEEVKLEINSEREPCRISGPQDRNYLALVMPMAI